MARRGVFAQTYVTCEQKGGEELGEELEGEDDGGIGVIRRGTTYVLRVRLVPLPYRLGQANARTFSIFIGTPKRITLFSPLATIGRSKPSSLLIPHRF